MMVIFGDLGCYFFGNVRDKITRPAKLHGDILPLVDQQLIVK